MSAFAVSAFIGYIAIFTAIALGTFFVFRAIKLI